MKHDLLSIRQAAELLGMTRQALDKRIRAGELPVLTIDTYRALQRKDVVALAKRISKNSS